MFVSESVCFKKLDRQRCLEFLRGNRQTASQRGSQIHHGSLQGAESQKFSVQTAAARAAVERDEIFVTCGERRGLENNWPHDNLKTHFEMKLTGSKNLQTGKALLF